MHSMRRQGLVAAMSCAVLVGLFGCSGDPDLQETPGVKFVEVNPSSLLLGVGEEQSLEVTAFDKDGRIMGGQKVTYASSAPEVASVSEAGVVMGQRQGAATVTVTVGKVRATVGVEVLASVASIRIQPDPVEMLTEDTVQLEATAFDLHGNVIEGKGFAWEVENTRVATVDQKGNLTSLRRGEATEVIASVDGVEGRAQVLVRKRVGRIDIEPAAREIREKSTLQLVAVVRDDGGQAVEGWDVSWGSSAPEIASIDEKGLLQGNAPGVVEITAEAGGVQATVEFLVKPQRVFRVELEPGEVTLAVGETLQFRVRTYNESGEELFGRAIEWEVLDRDTRDHAKAAGSAPVDDSGLLQAARPIRALVVATVVGDGVFAIAEVDVVLRLEGVSAGRYHTCALTGGGEAWCWGRNFEWQCGRAYDDELLPHPVTTDRRFRAIGAGANHTCALDEEGAAFCWGRNDHGQFGDGGTESRFTPTRVVRPTNSPPFARVFAGDGYSCGLDTAGRASCWGRNFDGRLGNGSLDPSLVPAPILGEDVGGTILPVAFADLSLGANPSGTERTITCGISTSGVAYCWGQNETQASGIGAGETLFASQPVRVEGDHTFQLVSVGRAHVCGLTMDGQALCWGDGAAGQLGDGGSGMGHSATVPVAADTTSRYVILAAGGDETCALTADGALDCWGGYFGQGAQARDRPTRLGQDDQWVFEVLSRGEAHTCGIDAQQVVFCWGENFQGQLGNDGSENRLPTPTRIFPEND